MYEKLNSYPIIYVHGFNGYGQDELLSKKFPYFGVWNGDVRKTARNIGLECYIPSMGSYTSAWDRSCELYAHIVGGRVDYGKVHSEKNGHRRYGKTFEALIPDWGKLDESGKIKKINLIAHSFGGPTARQFIHLMAEGNQDEIDSTPENELSELFKGGHEKWIHSLTSMACTHNGVTLFQSAEKFWYNIWKFVLKTGTKVQGTFVNKVFDFGLAQFDFKKKTKGLFKPNVNIKSINKYLAEKKDLNFFEMEIDGSAELTKDMHTYDSIYYFSYAGNRTKKMPFSKSYCPTVKMWAPLWPMAILEGFYSNYDDKTKPLVTDEWRANDCCVNVISAIAPFNEKQANYEDIEKCVPGIWYKMPVEDKDHGSYMGVGESIHNYNEFNKDLMLRVCSLKSI